MKELSDKDRLGILERSLEKERNRRKMLRDEVHELRDMIDILMEGWSMANVRKLEEKKDA
jgi:predicted RNase H-like nuclease (RuvC/YqgF family)